MPRHSEQSRRFSGRNAHPQLSFDNWGCPGSEPHIEAWSLGANWDIAYLLFYAVCVIEQLRKC